MNRRNQRRPILSLSQLRALDIHAAWIWLALLELAAVKGSVVVTPTRAQLSTLSGIQRMPSISKALTTLEAAGWIDRVHVPVVEGGRRTATLMRIFLRKERVAFATGQVAVRNATRSKGKEHVAFHDSLRERGGPSTAAVAPVEGPPQHNTQPGVQPVADSVEDVALLDETTKMPLTLALMLAQVNGDSEEQRRLSDLVAKLPDSTKKQLDRSIAMARKEDHGETTI